MSELSRRAALRWMTALSGGMAISAVAPGYADESGQYAPWPQMKLAPVQAAGYGTDPDLITPAPAPWPRLLTTAQRQTSAVLADIIVPREGQVPAASEVGVVELIDEWVSAPYPQQQGYRQSIIPGLAWLDDEAGLRFGTGFVQLSTDQQLAIVDDIATPGEASLSAAHAFFVNFRTLVVGGFYTSPAGSRDLGYLGNVPIAGDYPGPSPAAMAHLNELLAELKL
ncbi:MAG: gluconate 2-dehydrogenase subunit 3 family protein [Pseudomonadales bacterium]